MEQDEKSGTQWLESQGYNPVFKDHPKLIALVTNPSKDQRLLSGSCGPFQKTLIHFSFFHPLCLSAIDTTSSGPRLGT
uniref:Ovule protein n=1 Tax=Steinernema glaseri TaxID=37863 RepID=A0A1I8A031_9BILA